VGPALARFPALVQVGIFIIMIIIINDTVAMIIMPIMGISSTTRTVVRW
jgi:hypothetical protein